MFREKSTHQSKAVTNEASDIDQDKNAKDVKTGEANAGEMKALKRLFGFGKKYFVKQSHIYTKSLRQKKKANVVRNGEAKVGEMKTSKRFFGLRKNFLVKKSNINTQRSKHKEIVLGDTNQKSDDSKSTCDTVNEPPSKENDKIPPEDSVKDSDELKIVPGTFQNYSLT